LGSGESRLAKFFHQKIWIFVFFGFLLGFGFEELNKFRGEHHIFDFLPKLILNETENGIKPLPKCINLFKADMNLLAFFSDNLVDGFENKAMILSGFGLAYKVKPQIVSIKLLIPLDVKVHFIKIDFEVDFFPTNFAVSF
jgi:hypothetical protein